MNIQSINQTEKVDLKKSDNLEKKYAPDTNEFKGLLKELKEATSETETSVNSACDCQLENESTPPLTELIPESLPIEERPGIRARERNSKLVDHQNDDQDKQSSSSTAQIHTMKSLKSTNQEHGIADEKNVEKYETPHKSEFSAIEILNTHNNTPSNTQNITTLHEHALLSHSLPTVISQPFVANSQGISSQASIQINWEILAENIKFVIHNQGQSTTIDMDLPGIGPLKILVDVMKQNANATFISNDPGIRDAIEMGLPQLRHALTHSGIHLQNTHVTESTGLFFQNTARLLKVPPKLLSPETQQIKFLLLNESSRSRLLRVLDENNEVFE